MTYQELIDYYANLLILQYIGKSTAYGTIQRTAQGPIMGQYKNTVQTIDFVPPPESGTFQLAYGINNTPIMAWNVSTADLLANLQALTPVGTQIVTVLGQVSDGSVEVVFANNLEPELIQVVFNNLDPNSPLITQGGDFLDTQGGDQLVTQ